jgi:Nif-specific regulatory protein
MRFMTEFAGDAAPTIRDAQFFDYTRSESGTGITIVGESRIMREMKEVAFQAASVSQELTILIRGASGTGKEYFARFIHFNSHRKNKPFEVINCANISDPLLESELFGHVKGAFTDSRYDKVGIFESANGGTVFLDEIGDLQFNLQGKLLRVLEQKSFRRVGDHRLRTVDVRVITATNKDLRAMVRSGEFRQDLYFRLEQWVVNLPALLERREDIPLLVSHFLYKHRGAPEGKPKKITSEALAVLWRQDWPGNVRELENFVQKLIVFSGKDQAVITEEILDKMARRFNISLQAKISTRGGDAAAEIARALLATRKGDRFNKSLAALFLGWDRNTLRQKMSQHGIDEGILRNEH